VKLEPCPFCGLPNPHYDPDIQAFACPCSATGPSMLSREFDDEGKTYDEVEAEIADAAAKAWNRRQVKP
jgi:hypothetical protein